MEIGAALAWWVSGIGTAMTFIGAKSLVRDFLVVVTR